MWQIYDDMQCNRSEPLNPSANDVVKCLAECQAQLKCVVKLLYDAQSFL